MADLGRVPPILALWGPFAVFLLISLLAFLRLDRKPGDGWPTMLRARP
jgi:lipopolysaccharide export LptBFGC system permease protein LptF